MKKSVGKYALIICLVVAGLYADYSSKKWAQDNLKSKSSVSAIKGFVELGFIENRGMVFGILNRGGHQHAVISVVSWVRVAVCIAVSIYIAMRLQTAFLLLLPFLFIWMGAVGNLIDSLAVGCVVDFIHIHAGSILDWPFYFNLADAYVCVGGGMLVLIGIFVREKRPTAPSTGTGLP